MRDSFKVVLSRRGNCTQCASDMTSSSEVPVFLTRKSQYDFGVRASLESLQGFGVDYRVFIP